MKKQLFLYRINFILDFLKVLLCCPLGCLLYCIKDIYIVCERGTDARDNGYHMFKYIVENHPDKKVYYVIDKRSADYPKVARLGKVINYKSWKHALYFVAAKTKISTHVMGYAPGVPYYFGKIHRYIKFPGKHVFLQHGVIKDDLVSLHRHQARMDLFICGAKPEYEFVRDWFGHPDGVIRYTGLARYDNLHGHKTKREILIMPTWRMYLSRMNKEEFRKSEYYIRWNEILQDPRISDILRKNDLKLVFYPHYEMQKFIDCFNYADENIVVANFGNFDVQQLLIDAKMLITDYSSVFFDFAYMKKPCAYFQFDRDEFFSKHYKKGYFDYLVNGFGPVALVIDELLEALKNAVDHDFVPETDYLKKMDMFFELHDNHNCERIYKAIEDLR